MTKFTIRKISTEETGLLRDFLYEAIYVPQGMKPPDRSIIDRPELHLYIEDFGKKTDDHCLVAEVNGKVVGAVWARIMDDYGHIDDETPSLAISLYPEYRNMGIGTALMTEMLSLLSRSGYRQASLSVQKENYAVRMYRSLGFHVMRAENEEFIMVVHWGQSPVYH